MPHLPLAVSGPDGVVLGLAGFFALRGALKGFVWQAVRTGGLVIGLLLGTRWAEGVGRFLTQRFALVPEAFEEVAGWLVVVVGAVLVTTLVAHLLRRTVADARLGGLDRLLGLFLGAVLGLGIAAFGFTLWASTRPASEVREALGGSWTVRYMARLVTAVRPLFPDGVRDRWAPVLDSLPK